VWFRHPRLQHQRCQAPDGDDPEAFCRRLLTEVEAAILAPGPDEVASIIAEPVQNSGGSLVLPLG
jgi:adenosylmethionine-8-amino-7-oxononanoate aminotransferase